MNSIFQLIASIKGNTEQNKTGTSEVILKNSGWVVPTGQISNTLMLFFKMIYENFNDF